ncbi:hypothetical protein [Parapedobacter koreensis]|uniref:Uncharacterized protein n=1 Tax=Parapedobacter koreensis TaxID=332977 RepID=A0A1H7FG27_9SPHI|nr:hypothetical protein [Parapedobacter koreensis]SEK24948.1 hypothetical protein SAMN05421740_101339 [Parapedobacter koreensis]
MDNLSELEQEIIDYLIDADTIGGNFDNGKSVWRTSGFRSPDEKPSLVHRFTIRTDPLLMASQHNDANIENLILRLFKRDKELTNVGIVINVDFEKNEATIHLMEKENADLFIIIGNWFVFQRVNYILVKVANFLKQLEINGFIDKVNLRNKLQDRADTFPFYINCDKDYLTTLEIKNKDVVDNFLNCFSYYYVPTFKLFEFKNNGYSSPELLIAKNDFLISKQNLKLAKVGLYTALFSALVSLVAIILTLYSIGIPASVKIDEKQIQSIIDSIKDERIKPIVIDTAFRKE